MSFTRYIEHISKDLGRSVLHVITTRMRIRFLCMQECFSSDGFWRYSDIPMKKKMEHF